MQDQGRQCRVTDTEHRREGGRAQMQHAMGGGAGRCVREGVSTENAGTAALTQRMGVLT